MTILLCALSANDYNSVQLYETAKDVWDTLQNTCEGTSQVKETKVTILTFEYETFRMRDDETIGAMFERFTKIIGGLKALGQTYQNHKLIKKVLNSLPKVWEPKVTAIEESKDLNTLSLDQLLGSFLAYEMKQKHNEVKHEASKAVDHKKKGVALKATEFDIQDEESDELDDDIALLS